MITEGLARRNFLKKLYKGTHFVILLIRLQYLQSGKRVAGRTG